MELNQSLKNNTIKKLGFKLYTKSKDGTVLQLHHTIHNKNNESVRLSFTTATFNFSGDHLACLDEKGNLFILDFESVLFWKLKEVGCAKVMCFHPENDDLLLIGLMTNDFPLTFVDTQTGNVKKKLLGHTKEIRHISFSKGNKQFLSASGFEAILWDAATLDKYFTLDSQVCGLIWDTVFIPSTDKVAVCTLNNCIQVRKTKTMKVVKQIMPNNIDRIKTITFSQNGRTLVIAGTSPVINLFCLDTWKILKTVNLNKFQINAVKQVDFIPQHFDGGSNNILAVFANCSLFIIDLESESLIYRLQNESHMKKVHVSKNGKYLIALFEIGEIHIFSTAQMLNAGARGDVLSASSIEPLKQVHSSTSKNIHMEMKKTLNPAKLKVILKLHGEYPERYRNIIWGILLGVPENKKAFLDLTKKPLHQDYIDLESKFNISSRKLFKILKKTLSCLTYWAPVFGLIDYLPYFIFPFVVTLQKYPFFLFEVLATIFINYCQLWFEFSPLPPINVLGMIENILCQHDSDLLKHFYRAGMSNQEFALPLLVTGFSEVLTAKDWLVLWDHILSNEPAFILMCVVAFNICQRNLLKSVTTKTDLVEIFHTQHALDMKVYLKKTYYLLEETNEVTHPRKYFKQFIPLQVGAQYQAFTGFPKLVVNEKKKLNDIEEVTSSPDENLIRKTSSIKNEMLARRKKFKKRSNMSCKVVSDGGSTD